MSLWANISRTTFWIGTFLAPVLIIAFGAVIGFLASDSDAMQEVASATGGNKDLTGPQVAGMLVGMILTMFLMMFGAQVSQGREYTTSFRDTDVDPADTPKGCQAASEP